MRDSLTEQRSWGWRQGFTIAGACCLAAAALAACAAPAPGAVTIGQVAPLSPPNTCNGGTADLLQPTVTSGNSYVVPAGPITSWTITSWSTSAGANGNQFFAMKAYRKVFDPAIFMAVGHEGPHQLAPDVLNTFSANLVVKPGDVLGLSRGPANSNCAFSAPGDTALQSAFTDLSDGQGAAFNPVPDSRVNISAVITPTNTFSFGDRSFNKKKGTETLAVNVPNPGVVALSGKGVKAASARSSATVPAAGATKLPIRATGKKRKTLDKKGKVKLAVNVTYTPTGGDPITQSTKATLKKKR
jgi:hypothetical protein